MILKISLRAKAGVPKTLVKRKFRLHSPYFLQSTLMLTESRGEFSDFNSIFRLRALRYWFRGEATFCIRNCKINMNFYSLAGVSAKVIDFANDFLKTTKKLNDRTETMLFFLECTSWSKQETFSRGRAFLAVFWQISKSKITSHQKLEIQGVRETSIHHLIQFKSPMHFGGQGPSLPQVFRGSVDGCCAKRSK